MEQNRLLVAVCLISAVGWVAATGTCPPSPSDATLTLAVDSWVNYVCIDGVRYKWPHVHDKRKSAICDIHTINIPYDAEVIGVRASNQHTFAGLMGCTKGMRSAAYGGMNRWLCQKASAVSASALSDDSWCTVGFNKTGWQAAAQKISTCKNLPTYACGLPPTSWYWTHDRTASDVVCVQLKCGKNCKSCNITGPGNCDPGQCYYGSSIDRATGKEVCNSQCDIDIQSYGPDQPAAQQNAYIKIKNSAESKYQPTFPKTFNPAPNITQGEFAMFIDMNCCSLTRPNVTNTCPTAAYTVLYLNYYNGLPELAGRLVLDITIDNAPSVIPARDPWCSAPFMTAWILNGTQYLNQRYTNAQLRVTGINGIISNFAVVKTTLAP